MIGFPASLYHFPIFFLPLYPYIIWRNPYTFRQNPIQFGETTGFRQTVSDFRYSPIFQQHFQTKKYIFQLKSAISYSFLPFPDIQFRKPLTFAEKYTFAKMYQSPR